MWPQIQPGARSTSSADDQVPLSTNQVAQPAGAAESAERWSEAAPAYPTVVKGGDAQSGSFQATRQSEVVDDAPSDSEATVAKALDVLPTASVAFPEGEDIGIQPAELGGVQDAGDALVRAPKPKKIVPQARARK